MNECAGLFSTGRNSRGETSFFHNSVEVYQLSIVMFLLVLMIGSSNRKTITVQSSALSMVCVVELKFVFFPTLCGQICKVHYKTQATSKSSLVRFVPGKTFSLERATNLSKSFAIVFTFFFFPPSFVHNRNLNRVIKIRFLKIFMG